MKKHTLFLLLAAFLFSMACQFLTPAADRGGPIISACTDLVKAFCEVQPGANPPELLETGIKQGHEFDFNEDFNAFTHISMEQGYTLDYVYQVDSLSSYPILYARSADQPAYVSTNDLPLDLEISDYLSHISVDDTEQGYFEDVALIIMARQFYLDWHANYNDAEIVCTKRAANDIIADINDGNFGLPLDASQQLKARTTTNIELLVKLTDDTATVDLIFFTKWGGFYRQTFTINRSFPHTITDVNDENIIEYDCGTAF